MSTDSAYPRHSFPQNWSALDLVDAVPLRLSDRIALGLIEFSVAPVAANNPIVANNPFVVAAPRGWRRGYAGSNELPDFRVR
ncbi:hypothetical protein J2X04_002970 [Lysobacter niabensis]|uniref:Uncharacterized protein n=1 Tax=Agrilutibacter niabensis TaxID=380628 RepID=A0ABU1VSX5_9GAMM|nr:hypothetical protein [Lysobacter niabensis]MDR7100589.1 hypothetical protein [Lysobacter niabensis]